MYEGTRSSEYCVVQTRFGALKIIAEAPNGGVFSISLVDLPNKSQRELQVPVGLLGKGFD